MICDNHYRREMEFPWLYPIRETIRGYCLADWKAIWGKLYHQTTINQYNIIPKILFVEFDESNDKSMIRF
jgi:hypothetical protein